MRHWYRLLVICGASLLVLVACRGTPAKTVVLMNTFVVAETDRAAFRERWQQVAEYMRRQPGFLSTTLHQAMRDDAHWFNYAIWRSAEDFQTAIATDEFRALTKDFPGEGTPRLYSVEQVLTPH